MPVWWEPYRIGFFLLTQSESVFPKSAGIQEISLARSDVQRTLEKAWRHPQNPYLNAFSGAILHISLGSQVFSKAWRVDPNTTCFFFAVWLGLGSRATPKKNHGGTHLRINEYGSGTFTVHRRWIFIHGCFSIVMLVFGCASWDCDYGGGGVNSMFCVVFVCCEYTGRSR